MDLCEFKTTLLYPPSSRWATTTARDPVFKQTNTHTNSGKLSRRPASDTVFLSSFALGSVPETWKAQEVGFSFQELCPLSFVILL